MNCRVWWDFEEINWYQVIFLCFIFEFALRSKGGASKNSIGGVATQRLDETRAKIEIRLFWRPDHKKLRLRSDAVEFTDICVFFIGLRSESSL